MIKYYCKKCGHTFEKAEEVSKETTTLGIGGVGCEICQDKDAEIRKTRQAAEKWMYIAKEKDAEIGRLEERVGNLMVTKDRFRQEAACLRDNATNVPQVERSYLRERVKQLEEEKYGLLNRLDDKQREISELRKTVSEYEGLEGCEATEKEDVCSECQGTGRVDYFAPPNADLPTKKQCLMCKGTGK